MILKKLEKITLNYSLYPLNLILYYFVHELIKMKIVKISYEKQFKKLKKKSNKSKLKVLKEVVRKGKILNTIKS